MRTATRRNVGRRLVTASLMATVIGGVGTTLAVPAFADEDQESHSISVDQVVDCDDDTPDEPPTDDESVDESVDPEDDSSYEEPVDPEDTSGGDNSGPADLDDDSLASSLDGPGYYESNKDDGSEGTGEDIDNCDVPPPPPADPPAEPTIYTAGLGTDVCVDGETKEFSAVGTGASKGAAEGAASANMAQQIAAAGGTQGACTPVVAAAVVEAPAAPAQALVNAAAPATISAPAPAKVAAPAAATVPTAVPAGGGSAPTDFPIWGAAMIATAALVAAGAAFQVKGRQNV